MTDSELDFINEQVAKALGWKYKKIDWVRPYTWDNKRISPTGEEKYLPDYSRSIEAAWEIISDRIEEVTICKQYGSGVWYSDFRDDKGVLQNFETAATAPLAICKAFLKLKEQGKP